MPEITSVFSQIAITPSRIKPTLAHAKARCYKALFGQTVVLAQLHKAYGITVLGLNYFIEASMTIILSTLTYLTLSVDRHDGRCTIMQPSAAYGVQHHIFACLDALPVSISPYYGI